ncbi:DUF6157 family protein [Neobacillus sp. SCS-31]|uniref:DUF6157 family protein n=1 Tax=Neobacillus oceani TaxID=3115292 RepID=UPI003906920B
MSYRNTFITVSEDCKATEAMEPSVKNNKQTVASIEYHLIKNNPYRFTQDDVQFETHIKRNHSGSTELDGLREQFFAKPKACFRASPLVKTYGWGIHYDNDGKVAIYGIDSPEYKDFLHSDSVKVIKGIRSKRQ